VDAKHHRPVQWCMSNAFEGSRAVHVLMGQAQQYMRKAGQCQALEDLGMCVFSHAIRLSAQK